MKYVPPQTLEPSFNCPHCGAFAAMTWSKEINCHYVEPLANNTPAHTYFTLHGVLVAKGKCCGNFSMWINHTMMYPITGSVIEANIDLPLGALQDYNEARTIVNFSPRGAAALLRLAVQKICTHLGEKGKNINDDIKEMVKNGLSTNIQMALDTVRVTGNNAVHPGVMDLKDNPEIAYKLFPLVNLICYQMITQPKELKEIYGELPERDKKAIEKRDSSTSSKP